MDSVLAYGDSPQQSIARAETVAKHAIAIDDKDAMAHCTLGRALDAQGDYSAAIAELRIALELNPSFALAHSALAMPCSSTAKPTKPFESWKRRRG